MNILVKKPRHAYLADTTDWTVPKFKFCDPFSAKMHQKRSQRSGLIENWLSENAAIIPSRMTKVYSELRSMRVVKDSDSSIFGI